MVKLGSLEFYNSPRVDRSVGFELDPDKQFFIMTGYNGAGKSRIISIISEAFSVARSGKFNSAISRWVFEAGLSNGAKVRALKMEVGGASKDDIEKLGGSFNDVDADLSDMFHAAKNMVLNRSKTRYTNDSEQESEQHFCISGGFVPTSLPSGDIAQVNLVSFIDESLYFNFPLNGADLALEDKAIESNIDRTLWLLMYAYIAKRLNQNHMNALLDRLNSFEKNGNVDFDSDNVKSLLKTAIQEMREASDLENGPVFAELNKFYGMTHRKLIWKNDTFQMIVPDEGVIPFTAFSKGEKTLLALLLAVSLYGDSAVFLLDEPDLSLHVEWQRMLLPAMQRLAPESQFIIGTHSPFLIMNTQSETVVNLAKKFKESN